MLETPHALVGIAIVSKIPNPFISLPLAFLSHFAVDMLPHWNWRPDGRPFSLLGIVIDLILVEVATFYFASQSPLELTIIAASFLAILPDLLEAPYIFFGLNSRFIKWLCDLQSSTQNRVPVTFGLATQLLLSGICLLILRG